MKAIPQSTQGIVGWVCCLLFVKLRAKGRKVVLIILNASTFCVLVFMLIELEENSITVCLHVFFSDMQAKHCPRSLVAQVFSVGSVYKHRLANTNPKYSVQTHMFALWHFRFCLTC